LRFNRKKSFKVSEVRQKPFSPYETESSARIDKSLVNARSGQGDKLLQLGMNIPSGVEVDKVTNHNDSNLELVGLKIEYHVEEDNEDDDAKSVRVDHRSTLFTQVITQAATSQYMQQSMDSSTANSMGGSPIAANSNYKACLNKLKSIEMNTRIRSDVGSNIIINAASSSTRNTLQQIDHAGLDERTESNPENIGTSCVELTTSGTFNSDLASLWANFRTQSHSQQSSVVSAETRASMVTKFTAGESCKLTSQELADALKVISYHITEVGKMIEKIKG
jgi:hypothetical protein